MAVELSWSARLDQFPTEPGIYLMRDRNGAVIYIGKAANLRSRLRSYFSRSGDPRAFVPLLEELLGEIETIVVGSEKEALLLENTLIKQHQPRFNVKLRDDKNFLLLRVDLAQEFPRVELVRRVAEDGARYFGPYPSAHTARELQRLVNRHFRLASCSPRVMASRRRPCLQHAMDRCGAPCVGLVGSAEYAQDVAAALLLLEGRRKELVLTLQARMAEAAQELRFEAAARLRDQIRSFERAAEAQHMVLVNQGDQDFHALARSGDRVAFSSLFLRRGLVSGQRTSTGQGLGFPDEEVLGQYINLFYDQGSEIPPLVVTAVLPDDRQAKEEWLSEKRGSKVRVIQPKRGDQVRLLEVAARNAALALGPALERTTEQRLDAAQRLADLLGLTRLPRRIECIDISTFHGAQPVGSLVVFEDGRPLKNRYRRYRIRDAAESDDFGMMRQVLTRRLKRGQAEQDLPDLLVVDGGRGQLGVAQQVVAALGLGELQLAGLAKSRASGLRGDGSDALDHSDERVFLPGREEPIPLPVHTPERLLLEQIRDEAHRFAITYHRQSRRKATIRSSLDGIPGVGPTRRRELLRRFGSVQAIRAAAPEELAQLSGIGLQLAERILRSLGRQI